PLDPLADRLQLRPRLGRHRLEVVFVHNPERAGHRTGPQLAAAFAVLEEKAAAGWIGGYGVATCSGFAEGAITVPGLLAAARAAGGAHHLVAVQLPVNLVLAGPIAVALNGYGPITDAARAGAGLGVYASAPLHGGTLPTLATAELADFIRPGTTIASACLLAAASCPGVRKLLLAASTGARWDDAHAAPADGPLAPAHLRRVLDVVVATEFLQSVSRGDHADLKHCFETRSWLWRDGADVLARARPPNAPPMNPADPSPHDGAPHRMVGRSRVRLRADGSSEPASRDADDGSCSRRSPDAPFQRRQPLLVPAPLQPDLQPNQLLGLLPLLTMNVGETDEGPRARPICSAHH
ncbi:hypothetical protein ACFC1B_29770, partial [Streptomyces xiamenensis]|uniref:hypothetical protein n=1 Tax=Streptomyces xiamenensis TaxID=408015 RepID=UPI0035DCCD94